MLAALTFIFIFGTIVVIHELGHFYFAKKAGILVREFAIGMGPKIFAHIGQDGTAYTIRILPLGGYVRMAGWGEDETEIKTGTPVTLTLNGQGLVTRVNLSSRQLDPTSLPMNVTAFDFEDKLEITGLVLDETKTYALHHDATIVEEDGTEVRIAPLDVQYQNASIGGRLMTNFAGPMNNFILGVVAFIILVFMQGGVQDLSSNIITVADGGAMQLAGVETGDRLLQIDGHTIQAWSDITDAVDAATQATTGAPTLAITYEHGEQIQTIEVTAQEKSGQYLIGVGPEFKTDLKSKFLGGFQQAWQSAFAIFGALKNLVLKPSLDQLGGPVAIYQISSEASKGGWISIMGLLGMLSINLGIMNLLPIPVLDGGKILFNLVELIRRKPVKEETETYITIAGVAVMVLLMIAVTWNDIMRAFF